MNRLKKLLLLVMILLTAFTSGCWDKQELNGIALVSAIGVDKSEKGNLMGSYQIINPSNVAGALQGGGNGEKPPVAVLTSTGNNVLELDRTASSKSSRYLYLRHANLLVISEELAKEKGIISFLDAFDRSANFRSTSRVVIARNLKAADIIETLASVDKVSGEKVIKTMQAAEEELGVSVSVNLQELIKNLVSEGREPIIGGITIKQKGDKEKNKKMDVTASTLNLANPISSGIGIFKNGKLVDWVDGDKAKGTMWVLKKIKTVNLNIDWENKKDAISYQAVRQKTKVKMKMKNGKPKMFIKVQAEGDIREVRVPLDVTETQVLMKIEKKLSGEIKKQINEAIAVAKENKTDIFGFGDIIYQRDPKAWEKLKGDWHEVAFPALEVDVEVETFIRRTGLRNKPFISEFKDEK